MEAGEEARLIGLARNGDMHAFGRLVDAHQAAVRAFLRRLVGNTADADDFSQEAFARTWEVLDRYDGRSSLRTLHLRRCVSILAARAQGRRAQAGA